MIRASGLTVMLATHNMEIAARMDRRVTIRDGQIVELPQLPFPKVSESMGNHDSKIVDAGSVD